MWVLAPGTSRIFRSSLTCRHWRKQTVLSFGMSPFRLIRPYQCDKREMSGSKQNNSYTANGSGREKKPHGADTEEGNKILPSILAWKYSRIYKERFESRDPTLTDQGWHKVCQSTRIAAF